MLSASLISSEPVAIPLRDVPKEFRLPEGADRRVINAGEAPVEFSLCLSSLSFCIKKCDGDAVTIEAWLPWGEGPPEASHCYLTKEAIEALAQK
jgi:hypothetical protein